MKVRGWAITWWITAAVAAMTAGVVMAEGWNEETVRLLVRLTARVSAVLFLTAFSASALHRLSRRAATRWLVKNRRYIGVGFAVSHGFHFANLMALATRFPEPFWDDLVAISVVGGGLAYLLIAAMAFTSTDRAQAALGRRWRQLHLVGGYYIWSIFALDYVPDLFDGGLFSILAVLVLTAFGLRVAARIYRVRPRTTAP